MHTKAFFFDQQPHIESVLPYAVLTTYAMLPRAYTGKNKCEEKKYLINSLGFKFPSGPVQADKERKKENQFTF